MRYLLHKLLEPMWKQAARQIREFYKNVLIFRVRLHIMKSNPDLTNRDLIRRRTGVYRT